MKTVLRRAGVAEVFVGLASFFAARHFGGQTALALSLAALFSGALMSWRLLRHTARLDAVMASEQAETARMRQQLMEQRAFADAEALRHQDSVLRLDQSLTNLQQEIVVTRQELAVTRQELAVTRQELAVTRQELAVAQQGIVNTENALHVSVGSLQTRLEVDIDTVRSGIRDLNRYGTLPYGFHTSRSFDPEIDILKPIYDLLRSKRAIDVGANRGEFTAALLAAGFGPIDSFEPLPSLHAELMDRFLKNKKVRVHGVACSDTLGQAQLKLTQTVDAHTDATLFSSLEDTGSVTLMGDGGSVVVPLATLNSILAPKAKLHVGLLKTDTEGHDVAVLRGAGRIIPEMIISEVWDTEYVFNLGHTQNTLSHYLEAVDQKDFPHSLLMWRGTTREAWGIAGDAEKMRPGSWGNVLFLRSSAQRDVLLDWARRTYGHNRVSVGK
jgi:FkbM family methyltransferase